MQIFKKIDRKKLSFFQLKIRFIVFVPDCTSTCTTCSSPTVNGGLIIWTQEHEGNQMLIARAWFSSWPHRTARMNVILIIL